MRRNIIIQNLSYLLATGLIIKILGLYNKIILTRLMGIEGISLYTLAYPTILLFANLSSFSFKEVLAKLVSENIALNKSNKKLISNSIILSLGIVVFLSFIICFIGTPLEIIFEKESLSLLVYTSIPLVFFVSLGGVIKGYLMGIKRLDIVAKAQLIEQIFRIVFALILVITLIKQSILLGVFGALLALSIGEGIAFLYLLFKISRITKISFKSNLDNEYKKIIFSCLPLSLCRLISSISFFFEPIIFAFALKKTGLNQEIINKSYGIINGYALPLLTLISFIAFAIASSIIPYISEANAQKNYLKINRIINTSFYVVFLSSGFFMIVLYLFPHEYLFFLFKTTLSASYVKGLSLFFILYYLNIILSHSIMASNNPSDSLKITLLTSIIKLFFLYYFCINPNININGLSFSISISLITGFLLSLSCLKKSFNFNLKIKKILQLSFVLFLSFFFMKIISPYMHFLLCSFLGLLLLISLLLFQKKSFINEFKNI